MKKKSLLFTCLLLVVAMMALLCSCGSSWGSIKSAFKKEGFEEVKLSDEIGKLYESMPDYQQMKDVVELHILQPKDTDALTALAKTVIIAEFKSNKDMEEALKAHVTQQDAENIYEELQKLDNVSGNCFLLLPGLNGLSIFKGTK